MLNIEFSTDIHLTQKTSHNPENKMSMLPVLVHTDNSSIGPYR